MDDEARRVWHLLRLKAKERIRRGRTPYWLAGREVA
jgi:hypothetical protein